MQNSNIIYISAEEHKRYLEEDKEIEKAYLVHLGGYTVEELVIKDKLSKEAGEIISKYREMEKQQAEPIFTECFIIAIESEEYTDTEEEEDKADYMDKPDYIAEDFFFKHYNNIITCY